MLIDGIERKRETKKGGEEEGKRCGMRKGLFMVCSFAQINSMFLSRI